VGVAAAGVRVATAEAGAGVGGGAGLLLWRGELGRGGSGCGACLMYVLVPGAAAAWDAVLCES